ncbi:MAG TPA: STAS domain-containing protein [Xanthobacteraceae bacterium]|jgi:anti-anti-sigma regulatory factor|nr:STAS domain-containing protein [Xanthobacteraceae bacterium]
MAMIAAWLKIDEERVAQELQEAAEKLDSAEDEVVLDFSSVRRIEPSVLRAMEEFAGKADNKGVKVLLRGVNVDVYRVLTLVRLTSRFSFVN